MNVARDAVRAFARYDPTQQHVNRNQNAASDALIHTLYYISSIERTYQIKYKTQQTAQIIQRIKLLDCTCNKNYICMRASQCGVSIAILGRRGISFDDIVSFRSRVKICTFFSTLFFSRYQFCDYELDGSVSRLHCSRFFFRISKW